MRLEKTKVTVRPARLFCRSDWGMHPVKENTSYWEAGNDQNGTATQFHSLRRSLNLNSLAPEVFYLPRLVHRQFCGYGSKSQLTNCRISLKSFAVEQILLRMTNTFE